MSKWDRRKTSTPLYRPLTISVPYTLGAVVMLDGACPSFPNGINLSGKTGEDGSVVFNLFPADMHVVNVHIRYDKTNDWDQVVPVGDSEVVVIGKWPAPIPSTWIEFGSPVVFKNTARPGLVRANGKYFEDDNGIFYPLGGTLFWALRGWKLERDRVKANLKYLSKYKFDFVRILVDVDWAGNDISPLWDDYERILGELIDYCYDECGLRVELTSGSGGSGTDLLEVAHKVVRVINNGRNYKVIYLEVCNEAYQNLRDDAKMEEVGKFYRSNTPNLVAWTDSYNGPDEMAKYHDQGATIGTVHLDRTYSDDGWRAVRQTWDYKNVPYPISSNEPLGPRSSITENVEPIQLSCLRANGILCGITSFVLHNAAGVAGLVDNAHNRPANLWEVPGIDDIMKAVRGIDAFIPDRPCDGSYYNTQWGGNPLKEDGIWADGDAHGLNRGYLIRNGSGLFKVLSGVKDYVILTSIEPVDVDFYDILLGKVQTFSFSANQSFRLSNSPSKDSKSYGAYLAVGRFK